MPNTPQKPLPLTIMLIGTLLASFSNIINADTLERPLFSAAGAKMSTGSATLIYSFGQPFVSTTPSPLQIGFFPPDQTNQPGGCQIDPTAEEWACVQFQNIKAFYNIGDQIKVDIQINVKVNRLKPVDLWLAIEYGGSLIFKTPSGLNVFDPKAQAYKTNLQTLDIQHTLLDFELIPGLGGEYTFYALYVDEGQDLIAYLNQNKLEEIQRSNLAMQKTTLANE